ncbi:serine/threonine-protein kinase 31-like isoform X3 [Pomacea canaliculata]|nr:serine/threonine-protein kinase 31-like isoform X3 [Pomacea canaliculata]
MTTKSKAKMKRVSGISTFDVYISNLPKGENDSIEKKISKMFTKFGETKALFIKENNQGKYAIVKYMCEEDAEKAINECNGILLDGTPLLCKRMVEKRPNKPSGGGVAGAPAGIKDNLANKFQRGPDIVPAIELASSSSPGPPELEHAMITHVETPTLLWAQVLNDSKVEEQSQITVRLAEVCPTACAVQGSIDMNKIYGCKFSEDGLWYRCQVKSKHNSDKMKVQYIDFGNCEEVNPKDLVELPDDLTTPKPCAIKIVLHNIRYNIAKEKEAIAYVREQTENQYIDIQSRFRLPDGSGHFVDVYVNGLHLNQDLVDKDFAVQKMLNKAMLPRGGGDASTRPPFPSGESVGAGVLGSLPTNSGFGGPGIGPLGSGSRQVVGEPGKIRVTIGGGPGISSSFSDQPFLKPDQSISDIKQDLKVKARNLEKITKERDIACAELNSLKGKIKNMQSEFSRLQASNITALIHRAADMAEKVRKIRSQFSHDQPSPVEEAIKLACSTDKLQDSSIPSLSAVMTTLKNYRAQQSEICQLTDAKPSQEMLESRNVTRKLLYKQLTSCIQEMEQMPITERVQSISQTLDKLNCQYDAYFSMSIQETPDLPSLLAQYDNFKTQRKEDFRNARLQTDQQEAIVGTALQNIREQMSVTSDGHRDASDLDLSCQLRQYCQCLQHEVTVTNIEGSQDASFIASLVQTVYRELKSEVLCANNFLRMHSEFSALHSSIEGWLDNTPTMDKLMACRQTLKVLRSKLRHRLADKHDAEENDDKQLHEIEKDVISIQREIHESLIAEDKEMSELAKLVDSHFPELLLQHPDCGIDIYLTYNGLIKPSHEVDHFDLKPVPAANGGLFYSMFAGNCVIIMECLLSDGHHMGREEFLAQLTTYNSISHPALLHPVTVFFDKNNRHAYLQFEKDGDILANYVEHARLTKMDVYQVVKSVVEGLKMLHEKKVLHGEVHPHNIILRPDGTAGLLPPDLSCCPLDRAKNKYAAPNGIEFIDPAVQSLPANSEPNGSVDIFSVGVLTLWLCCPTTRVRCKPDGSIDVSQLSLDQWASGLVKTLTAHVPQLRPSAEMLLQTNYFLQPPYHNDQLVSIPSSSACMLPPAHSQAAIGHTSVITPPDLQRPPPPLPSQVLHHVASTRSTFSREASPSFCHDHKNASLPPCTIPDAFASSDSSCSQIPPLSFPAMSNHRQFPPPLPGSGRIISDIFMPGSQGLCEGHTAGGFKDTSFQNPDRWNEPEQGGWGDNCYQERASPSLDHGDLEVAGITDATQGHFEIGTFSLEDICDAPGGGEAIKGRKITRESSDERNQPIENGADSVVDEEQDEWNSLAETIESESA